MDKLALSNVGHILKQFVLDTRYGFAHPGSNTTVEPCVVGSPLHEGELRVLSLNVWGPGVAPVLRERIEGIAPLLSKYDLCVLQECWQKRDCDTLQAAAKQNGLPYSQRVSVGIGFPLWPGQLGSGLLIISRFPIVDVVYKRFAVSGKPYKIQHADYFGGKGVVLVRIQTSSGLIDVYDTHLHAPYSYNAGHGDNYLAYRVAQAWELSQFVRATHQSPLAIVCGDLNSSPYSIPVRLMQSIGLCDVFMEKVGVRALELVTSHADDNTWTPSQKRGTGARFDFIFYRRKPSNPHPAWTLQSVKLEKDYVDLPTSGQRVSVSDHFGVSAAFSKDATVAVNPNSSQAVGSIEDAGGECLAQALMIIEGGEADARRRRKIHRRLALAALLVWFFVNVVEQLDILPSPVVAVMSTRLWLFIDFALPVYALLEWLLSQFTVTEEANVLHQFASEIRICVASCQAHPAGFKRLWE